MFYEVIYETGSHSVMECENDEEALRGLEEHHRRAVEGLIGGPSGHPAERVKKVLKYNEHPATLGESQAMEVARVREEVNLALEEKAVGDMISVPELASSIRDITSPLVMNNPPHESDYKMQEVGVLEGSWS